MSTLISFYYTHGLSIGKTLTFALEFSSLDNDALIGSINKSEESKAKKGLKSNSHVSNRVSQRKNIDINVTVSNRTVATKSGTRLKDHKLLTCLLMIL